MVKNTNFRRRNLTIHLYTLTKYWRTTGHNCSVRFCHKCVIHLSQTQNPVLHPFQLHSVNSLSYWTQAAIPNLFIFKFPGLWSPPWNICLADNLNKRSDLLLCTYNACIPILSCLFDVRPSTVSSFIPSHQYQGFDWSVIYPAFHTTTCSFLKQFLHYSL